MLRFLTIKSHSRRTLVFASATHVWSDLFFALFVPLLVLIKTDPDMDLSFTEVGLLRSTYAGASAVLQVPAGFLTERLGEFWLLVGGNIWVSAGLVLMAAAPSFLFLLAATLLGGLGGGTQHPLASSMVSRAYDERARSTAVGTVNFAGDLGKMAAPALALLVAAEYGWRATMRWVGFAGLVFMAVSIFARKGVDKSEPSSGQTPADPDGDETQMAAFVTLSGVGFLDSATRAAALTFIPFLLVEKGMSTGQTFGMLILLLAGGAVGKFVCGWLDDRYGSVSIIWGTKALTALLLVLSLATPRIAIAPLMIVLGIGLNGTSSVLYGTVAAFVPPARRARLYGFFYTTNETGAVLAPLFYGIVADVLKLRATMVLMALLTALILPASLPLARYLHPAVGVERSRKS